MKPSHLAAVMLGCFPGLANSAAPEQVIHSCLKAQSTRDVRYIDVAPSTISLEEDEDIKRNTTTVIHGKRKYGLWESTNSDDFGLVYNNTSVGATKVERVGTEAPAPFDPYTAQWGEARYGKQVYLCITFNFEGLGQSGSFQNIRGAYVINPRKPPKFYYAVGDIRAIKD